MLLCISIVGSPSIQSIHFGNLLHLVTPAYNVDRSGHPRTT